MTVYRLAILSFLIILCAIAAWYVFGVLLFGMLMEAL